MATQTIVSKYHFNCSTCGKVHKMGMYAIAQLASGNSLIHTCDECDGKTSLEPEILD